MSARLLVELLRASDGSALLAQASALDGAQWNGLIAAARAERLLGALAVRIAAAESAGAPQRGAPLPQAVRAVLADARFDAEREKRQALWEADRALAALRPLGIPLVLLKGTAYVAAGLRAGEGRSIGDLDILVPRARLEEAERALLAAGWEWVKPDPYDDAYYRRWMHELPPLIHKERDRMIDVHHTILPLTARPKPDAVALLADRVAISGMAAAGGGKGGEVCVLSAEDRICHAVAHMLADGDLSGGLRNLWDIHCLLAEQKDKAALAARAAHHGLAPHLARARRLAGRVYGADGRADGGTARLGLVDRLFLARLLSTDGWGRDGRKLLGFAFYVRSHLLRMPPGLLARHLWTKWRKGYRPV